MDYEYLEGNETLPELVKKISNYYSDSESIFVQLIQKYMGFLPKNRQKRLIEELLPYPLQDVNEQVEDYQTVGGKVFYVSLSESERENRRLYNECLSYYRKTYNPHYRISAEDEE